MEVTADSGQHPHRLDHPQRDVAWMGAGEADARKTVDGVQPFEERGEVTRGIVRRLVVIDDLPEQLDLPCPRGNGVTGFRHDIRDRAHALVTPRVWDDAEGAELVAPFD